MKCCHWSLKNGSGMHRVAESIAAAEVLLGHDSVLVNPQSSDEWETAVDADVQVVHTHLPTQMAPRFTRPLKTVYVGHGTPDHVFQSSVEAGSGFPYGFGNSMLLTMEWLRNADAVVSFWPRHKWIYDPMMGRGRTVNLVPLGVDRAFWGAGATRGKFTGSPSLFTAENPHYIKWPYDLFTIWRTVADMPGLEEACLHAIYLAKDQHWWFAPWVTANGCAYRAHISPVTFDRDGLRNAFQSTDFFIGLVRYGDFNQLSLQASAAGATTISYVGNEYADYWMHEGDQRVMAAELTAILTGQAPKRETKATAPDIAETAAAMVAIYERIL